MDTQVQSTHHNGGKSDKSTGSPSTNLPTPGGKLSLSSDVVATIAGLAARDIPGIHKLGRSRLIEFGDSPTRGVAAEVGRKQAAFDLEAVIEYGCNIDSTCQKLRARIAEEVRKMAGREVVEVNIDVVDIHMPDSDEGSNDRRVI